MCIPHQRRSRSEVERDGGGIMANDIDYKKEWDIYQLSVLGMDIDELIDNRIMFYEEFVKEMEAGE